MVEEIGRAADHTHHRRRDHTLHRRGQQLLGLVAELQAGARLELMEWTPALCEEFGLASALGRSAYRQRALPFGRAVFACRAPEPEPEPELEPLPEPASSWRDGHPS